MSLLHVGIRGRRPGYKKWRAFLNGTEITTRCRAVDTVEGWAEVYETNPDGSLGPTAFRIYGEVQLERIEHAL